MKCINIQSLEEGSSRAFDITINQPNKQIMLWLSGGSSPKLLYKMFAEAKRFHPATVALVDERFGPHGHEQSNEVMIERTGLVQSLKSNHIPFFPVLPNYRLSATRDDLNKTASTYNEVIKNLVTHCTHHLLIMGLGADGHTAGIFPDMTANQHRVSRRESRYSPEPNLNTNRDTQRLSGRTSDQLEIGHALTSDVSLFGITSGVKESTVIGGGKTPDVGEKRPTQYVAHPPYAVGYSTEHSEFKDRITITPYALQEMAKKNATILIMAFGKDKKEAVTNLVQNIKTNTANDIFPILESLGARIILITDQQP